VPGGCLVIPRRAECRAVGGELPDEDVAPFVLQTLPMWIELVRAGVDPEFDAEAPDGRVVAVRLGDVPAVLLSETCDDLRVIAGA
jgi:hypothetical protein